MTSSRWLTQTVRTALLAAFCPYSWAGTASARIIRMCSRETGCAGGIRDGRSAKPANARSSQVIFMARSIPTIPSIWSSTTFGSRPAMPAAWWRYSATFALSKPIDMSKASGVLLYTVANRGNACPQKIPEANCQDSVFAYDDGHVGVASGWQGDLRARAGMQTLISTRGEESGRVEHHRACDRQARQYESRHYKTVALNTLTYQKPVSLDTKKATLTKRASEGGEIIPVPSGVWAFAVCEYIAFPVAADPAIFCVMGGFVRTYLYEVVYTA